ncbi:unnamed protein product [Prorocentrum cordatum]|uniref:Secreted protein n=1 Tax=Prorocentrum cordatum TaxID=2364126 RepID=A0ABN9RJX9_9DINO|nr:unnamed protein product [Polarella glacialis]
MGRRICAEALCGVLCGGLVRRPFVRRPFCAEALCSRESLCGGLVRGTVRACCGALVLAPGARAAARWRISRAAHRPCASLPSLPPSRGGHDAPARGWTRQHD